MSKPADRPFDALAPRPSVDELRRMASAELSVRARLAHVALLLAALGVAAAVGSLWLTEPALPPRTHLAFALVVGVGLSWVGYAAWVLTRRRVLLAGHRVVAAKMAVTFCALFLVCSLALGALGTQGRAPYAAAALGLAMLGAAVALLVRARRRFAALSARRDELQRTVAHGRV